MLDSRYSGSYVVLAGNQCLYQAVLPATPQTQKCSFHRLLRRSDSQ
jgi:hypothetical protein